MDRPERGATPEGSGAGARVTSTRRQNSTSANSSTGLLAFPRFACIRKGASAVFVVTATPGRLKAGGITLVSRKYRPGLAMVRVGTVVQVAPDLEIGTIAEQLAEIGGES